MAGFPPGFGNPWFIFYDEITTSDDGVETRDIVTLPGNGAGMFGYGSVKAAQDNGENGMRFNFWIDFDRNSAGSNALITGTVGPTGFTDVALPPWNNVGVPAGWAFNALNLSGTILQAQFNGAAGQNVNWRIVYNICLVGGATLA